MRMRHRAGGTACRTEKAEHFIFMEYHAIEQAESFERILNVLKDRTAHGVEVRIFMMMSEVSVLSIMISVNAWKK